MNYNYIEELVVRCKAGDEESKLKLCQEFKPFILNLSYKTFIDGYQSEDIQNECYRSLFRCLEIYNVENHRFVAYASIGIKNNLHDILRKRKTHCSMEGSEALTLSDNLEYVIPCDYNIDDDIISKCDIQSLKYAISLLDEDEREFIDFIFFKNQSIATYAYWKNISVSTARIRRKNILNKMKRHINKFDFCAAK